MEVESKVRVYEVEGQKVQPVTSPMILVKSHWNSHALVVIKCEDGKSYTVKARELSEAINNAVNSCK